MSHHVERADQLALGKHTGEARVTFLADGLAWPEVIMSKATDVLFSADGPWLRLVMTVGNAADQVDEETSFRRLAACVVDDVGNTPAGRQRPQEGIGLRADFICLHGSSPLVFWYTLVLP